MSALSPSATWQMVSPVAGLSVAKVLPETLSSHLPPMNSGWSLTFGGLTAWGFFEGRGGHSGNLLERGETGKSRPMWGIVSLAWAGVKRTPFLVSPPFCI